MAEHFPQLKIFSGPEEGQIFALTARPEVRLGRADENELALSDNSVSRHHCSVLHRDGAYFLKDVGSRNGTYINDEKTVAGQELKLFHLDLIRLGLYEIRFLERDYTPADLKQKDQRTTGKPAATEAKAAPAPKPAASAPEVEAVLADVGATDTSALGEERSASENVLQSATLFAGDRRMTWIFVAVAIFCVLFGITYFVATHRGPAEDDDDIEFDTTENTSSVVKTSGQTSVIKSPFQKKQQDTTISTDEDVADTSPETSTGKSGPVTDVGTQTTPDPRHRGTGTSAVIKTLPLNTTIPISKPDFNIFLDVKTEPITADIYLGEKHLGRAPFKMNISVKADETYDLYADFDLRDLHDVYRKKVNFKVKPGTDVVELKIVGEVAELKIMKLPLRSEFYLEGYYAYDKDKANPVKITNIVYGRPIYMPYGTYVVELREKVKLPGSDNEIRQIRYQREHTLDEKNSKLEISILDRDLQFFPAVIKSSPSNAEVIYAGEKVGTTPYKGMLAIGEHKLKLVKEGYFDAVVDVNMQLNAVYETTVNLTTSKIGELINKAKDLVRREQMDEALNTLVDALKYGGSAKEKGEVYFMLGDIYLAKKNYEQARPYFEKARGHADFRDLATLGLVKVYHHLDQDDLALPMIVEVLANISSQTPAQVKNAANSVFKQISPTRSVIYVYTEPTGAAVYVNDKKLAQNSPLIMSELSMGNYRIEIQKPGFKTFKTTQNLKLGEFVLVKVQLEPEQF